MVVPFALSIHSFINRVGADVGFASIIGLALLVLLHFAQARETSTLRKRLDESTERISSLEGRLAQALRALRPAGSGPPAVTPAPTGAGRPIGAVPAVRRVAAPAGAVGRSAPVAPMGMAAPALASATRMITTEPPAPAPTTTPAPVAVPAFAAPVVAAAVGAAASATALEDHPSDHAPAPDDTMLVAPATAAARGNGHEPTAIVAPTPPPPAPPPKVQIRTEPPAGPVRRTAPLPPPPRHSRFRGLLLGLLGLLVVAGIVIALLSLTSSPNQPQAAATHSHHAPVRSHHPAPPRFNPRLVTVAVLNGTGVNKLAADVAAKLTHGGYKIPSALVTNAAIQTHAATIVGYLGNHRADAAEVAKALNLPPASVAVADHDAISVCAGTSSSSCSADVIVTVGTDLSSVAASAGSP